MALHPSVLSHSARQSAILFELIQTIFKSPPAWSRLQVMLYWLPVSDVYVVPLDLGQVGLGSALETRLLHGHPPLQEPLSSWQPVPQDLASPPLQSVSRCISE